MPAQAEEYESNGSKQDRTDHIEGQMHNRSTLGCARASHTGKKCRHTGTDILTQCDVDCCIGCYDAVHSQGLQNTDRCRGTLQECCNEGTDDHTEKRIASQYFKCLCKDRSIRVWVDRS